MRLATARLRAAAACAAAALFAAGCGGGEPPPKMNDYKLYAVGQSRWQVGHQMYLVLGVPAFTRPVRIRSVELRPVFSTGQFDHPNAYLLVYYGSLFYNGQKLGYSLDPTVLAGSHRQALDSIRIGKPDNQLSLVVPVNIHQTGCHEAQLVLHVTTADGEARVYPTRWYVGLDTGISKVDEENGCDGARSPAPAASPSKSG